MAGPFSFSFGSPGGTQFSFGTGADKTVRNVAGEPGGISSRTLLIVGGLAAAAALLFVVMR